MSRQSSHQRVLRLVQISLFAALVAVFQIISTVVPMPFVRITLTLIPVVLGGIYFGKIAGAFLGAVFGAVVTAFTVSGFDFGANMMFVANPILTVFICFAKGMLAGFCAALVYELLVNKIGKTRSIFLSAAIAPIVNTAFFCVFLYAFYPDILIAWAGGTNVFIYMITGLVGINFVVEFLCNIIICPIVGKKLKF